MKLQKPLSVLAVAFLIFSSAVAQLKDIRVSGLIVLEPVMLKLQPYRFCPNSRAGVGTEGQTGVEGIRNILAGQSPRENIESPKL